MMMMNRAGQGQQRGPGGPGIQMHAAKARDFRGTMRKLIDYIGAYKLSIVIVLIFAIASTIFTIVGPKILGQATTKLFEGVIGQIARTGTGIDFAYIEDIILLLLGLYLLSALFSYIQAWVMAGVSMKVTYRLRSDIAAKINRLPLK